jgi:hypothetical protein
MRVLSDLSEEDLVWDPRLVDRLSNRALAGKMEQTYLSRIAYHKRKAGSVAEKLSLGQQIGILIWLNRFDLLSTKGEERLLFLQGKAPWAALEKGMKFAQSLDASEKMQLDFYHFMVVLNCFPSTKRLRLWKQANRIGVGYRDKGTLPSPSSGALKEADRSAWVHFQDLEEKLQDLALTQPDLVVGEWVDLPALAGVLAGLVLVGKPNSSASD